MAHRVTQFIIKLHNLSSGYTIFHRFMQFKYKVTNCDILKYRVTLVPPGAGVVCHTHLLGKDTKASDLCAASAEIEISIGNMLTVKFRLGTVSGNTL